MSAPVVHPEAGRSTPAFAARLADFGARIALHDEAGASISYADLAHRADAFAARLGAGRRLVLLEAANDVEAVVAYLGALRGGHPIIIVAEGASQRDRRILETYAPDAVFARSGNGWTLDLDTPRHALHPDLAIMLSTSGSTGTPKLVRLAGAAVAANAASIVDYLDIGADDRAITTLPIHYSYGLSVLNSHLAAGAAVILTPRSVIEPEFWALADRHGVTALAGVPYTYEMLDRAGFAERAPATLRTLTQAGGRLPAEAVARWGEWAAARGVRFFVMYGQTEATARMAYLPPDRLAAHADCIGVAIPGGRFELRGDDGPIDKAETPGELIYTVPNVMMGYASAAADLARGAELGELATGDIAVRTDTGLYRIVGRKSRFAKPFGLRIDLDEVEAALRRRGWQGVAAGDDSLIAVQMIGGDAPESVAPWLAAEFKLAPALFHVRRVESHPRLPSGKIDYPEILAAARAAVAATSDGAADKVEAAFVAAFGRTPAPADSFARSGGDSLGYVTFAMALEDALGTLPVGWEEMSFAALQARAATPRATAPNPRWKKVESEVLLRALAVVAVILNHSSDLVVGGGASVLLLLVGYNLARFQRVRLERGEVWPIVTNLMTRIILPYYVILLSYLAFKREFDLSALLLVGNFTGHFRSFIEPYWFLEALLQLTVIVALIFSVPALRRHAARAPWQFGLMLFGTAIFVKVMAAMLVPHARLADRTPDAVFYLLALGWCLYFARTVSRKLVVSAIILGIAALELTGNSLAPWWTARASPGNFSQDVWLVFAGVLLMWLPRITLPAWLLPPITAIAAASFYIYLVHVLPVHIMVYVLHLDWLPVTVAISLAAGLAAERVSRRWRSDGGAAVPGTPPAGAAQLTGSAD